MAWHKIVLVLKREYWVNFKRKSFLFSAFGVPLLTLVAMFLIIRFTTGRETNLDAYNRIGVIDRAGIVTALAPEGRYVLFTDPAIPAPHGDDPAAREAYFAALEDAARRQMEAGELDAYLVIADDYVLSGRVDLYTMRNVPAVLLNSVRDLMREQLSARAPDTLPLPPSRLAAPAVEVLRDVNTDRELSETALVGRMMLPFIFVFIYFLASSTTAQFLMSGVVEEKENRLMEILATSIRPLELLWGKMLGLAALSFTQIGLWLAAGLVIVMMSEGAREFVTAIPFAAGDILLVVVVFVINFLLFASMMLAIGAAVTAEAESRQLAGIFTFIAVLPMAAVVTFFTNPDGPLPLFFTFFPFTAATALILRFGLTTIPTWQIAISLAIQIVSVVAMMWLAAKIFRLGMLMYGKRLTPRAFWNALREGRATLTTAGEGAAPGGAGK